MYVSQIFYSRDFVNKDAKKAYLKACEWVAKNVLSKTSKVEVSKVTWRISRVSSESLPTFKLELFVTYDESEVSDRMCSVCKELHASFFINEDFNCSRCNKEAYRKKIKSKLDIGSSYFKEQIRQVLEKYN